jgi:hypothetical protein
MKARIIAQEFRRLLCYWPDGRYEGLVELVDPFGTIPYHDLCAGWMLAKGIA